jgi:tetratricopeptide (TPR) repeat protein
MRRELIAALRQRLSQPVYEVSLSEKERNPIDLIRALKPKPRDVICLFDLERALPEVLGYLDFQRETLTEMEISLVCWVTTFEHRELARRAPNFYAFRSSVFDFTSAEEPPSPERGFIGRKREVRELTKLLAAGGSVVLTGLGGVGKTALAQEVASEMHSHFSGGTVWVNCETKPVLGDILLTTAVGLIGEVARQYRPHEQRQRVEDVMRDRPCLLVLDNFETIAEDSATLHWLKTVSPPTSALIVSRQSVPYLSAPTLRLAELPTDDAVQLFTQRAHDAGWEGTDAEVVPRLCTLIGNLPLAIQLLAPRAAELPLTVLMEMVNKSLEALAAEKDPARAERQQSIAACFRVSFDRLSEDARTLLTRLSVLPDGLGADHIASFTGVTTWQQPLSECVRHSLLNLEGQRYRFHPLVRRFALAQLGDAAPEWQRRFVAFFRQLALENKDVNDLAKLAVLDAEWRNAIAAAETAEELKDWDAVVTLAESLGEFLFLRGRWAEYERLNRRAFAAARAADDRRAEGRALNNLGIVYQAQGRWTEAETAYQQSLTIHREFGDRPREGRILNNLGNVYQAQGRWAEAETAFQQSLAILREFGDRRGEGQTLANLALLREAQGNMAGVLEFGRQAVAVLETTEDTRTLAEVRQLLAKWEQQVKKQKSRKTKSRKTPRKCR